VECEKYRLKEYYVEKNRGQGVISNRQRWYKCSKREEKKVAHGQEFQKAQQKRGE